MLLQQASPLAPAAGSGTGNSTQGPITEIVVLGDSYSDAGRCVQPHSTRPEQAAPQWLCRCSIQHALERWARRWPACLFSLRRRFLSNNGTSPNPQWYWYGRYSNGPTWYVTSVPHAPTQLVALQMLVACQRTSHLLVEALAAQTLLPYPTPCLSCTWLSFTLLCTGLGLVVAVRVCATGVRV